MKCEPSAYTIERLAKDKVTGWEGVRNYQARNFMRDAMQLGDRTFFYHSGCAEPGIAGICEICSPAHPDETQFDPASPYFDPKSSPEKPRWLCVDVKFVRKTQLLTLAEMRGFAALSQMQILQRGNRLSITPVSPAEWDFLLERLK